MMDHAEKLPTKLEVCQMIFDSLLEILGPHELNEVLRASSLPVKLDREKALISKSLQLENWVQLRQGLLTRYGTAGTAGITIRTGQAMFKDYFYNYSSGTFLDDPGYRMLPKPARIHKGLENLAELQEKYVKGSRARIDQDQNNWYWRLELLNKWSAHPQLQDLLAKAVWGLVIEFVYWSGGGKIYPVHETDWANVDARERVITIQKKYVD